jgi:hypothetical protein
VTRSIYKLVKIQIAPRFPRGTLQGGAGSFSGHRGGLSANFGSLPMASRSFWRRTLSLESKYSASSLTKTRKNRLAISWNRSSTTVGPMGTCHSRRPRRTWIEFSLDIPNLNNKLVCEGIMLATRKGLNRPWLSSTRLPRSGPPRFSYKAVIMVCLIAKHIPRDKIKQREDLESALKTSRPSTSAKGRSTATHLYSWCGCHWGWSSSFIRPWCTSTLRTTITQSIISKRHSK